MNLMKLEDNQTINSLQLVDIINQIREEEGLEGNLRHSAILRKIRKLEAVVGMTEIQMVLSEYYDKSGKSNTMYILDKTSIRILAAGESLKVLASLVMELDRREKQVIELQQANIKLLEAKAEFEQKEKEALALISWEYRWSKKKPYGK